MTENSLNKIQRLLLAAGLALTVSASVTYAVQAPAISWSLSVPTAEQLAGQTDAEHTSRAWRPISILAGADWQRFNYLTTGRLAMAVGRPMPFIQGDVMRAQPARVVREFVDRHGESIGWDGCEPGEAAVAKLRKGFVFNSVPMVEGLPVFGAYLTLCLTEEGGLNQIKARGFGGDTKGGFSISEREAERSARRLTGIATGGASLEKVWLPVWEVDAHRLVPAWRATLEGDNPELRPELFLHAQSGELLAAANLVYYDRVEGVLTGWYLPRYGGDDPIEGAFAYEFIRINHIGTDFSSADGSYGFNVPAGGAPFEILSELRGRWVDVNYEDGPDASWRQVLDRAGRLDFVWTDRHSRLDERCLFWHVNFIHDYWKGLDADYDRLDYPMPAWCQVGNGFDNAFWNGQGIYFGDGREMDNFALYADVVYHEYGHAITSGIYPRNRLPYSGESGALNEAWSDYFPCSITNESRLGEGGLNGNGDIRNIDNNLVYPRDLRGEVHLDSRIISAAMWHTREILGAGRTDTVVHFARYRLGNDFLSHFTDILFTDDNNGDISDGTPNDRVLYAQFGRHGIGPGLVPDLVFSRAQPIDDQTGGADGDDNGLFEGGERIRLALELVRRGILFPPPAENVTVVVDSDSRWIEIVNRRAEFGLMRVGDTVRADESPIIAVREGAPVSFANLHLTIEADNGAFRRVDTLRIALGRPPLLLVRDGIHIHDRGDFYRRALDRLGVVYSEFDVSAPVRTLASRLELHRAALWFTGDAVDGVLTESSRSAVERYLAEGGSLLLTGQDVGEAAGAGPFLTRWFGARSLADSVSDRELNGVNGDPISHELRLLILGSPGALNQRRPGTVEAVAPAVEIFHWARLGGHPAAGVRREDPATGARTIYLAFGLEAVSGRGGSDALPVVLARALNWFGVETKAPEQKLMPTPLEFQIVSLFPNPFNGVTNLKITLPKPGAVSAAAYNVGGRLVMEKRWLSVPSGESELALDLGALPTGLYLLAVDSGVGRRVIKLTLLK